MRTYLNVGKEVDFFVSQGNYPKYTFNSLRIEVSFIPLGNERDIFRTDSVGNGLQYLFKGIKEPDSNRSSTLSINVVQ